MAAFGLSFAIAALGLLAGAAALEALQRNR
jgi:hypothetical protein